MESAEAIERRRATHEKSAAAQLNAAADAVPFAAAVGVSFILSRSGHVKHGAAERHDVRRREAMPINDTEARRIAENSVGPSNALVGVRERSWGWVFFYESVAYLKSGSVSDRLAGNAPLAIHREDGSLKLLPTYQSVDTSIQEYESAMEEAAGAFHLVVEEHPSPDVLARLRGALGGTLADAARWRLRLLGVLDSGSQTRMEHLRSRIVVEGLAAEVRRSGGV